MPNLLEWLYSDRLASGKYKKRASDFDRASVRDKESWHAYSKDPQQYAEQFRERMREVEKFVVTEPPADGRQLLAEIKHLSDTRHDPPPEPEPDTPSYRYRPSERN